MLEAHRYTINPMSTEELEASPGFTPPGQSVLGYARSGFGLPLLEYLESSTSPRLVVHDLLQSLSFRLDHRIQTILVKASLNGKDAAVLAGLQRFFGDPSLSWRDFTYGNLVARLGEVTDTSPDVQVYSFMAFLRAGEQEAGKGTDEEPVFKTGYEELKEAGKGTDEEPVFKTGYEELRHLYSGASRVVHGTHPQDLLESSDGIWWVNAILLMAEVGLLCQVLSNPNDLVLEPAVFRKNMVHFFSSEAAKEAATERHAGAHFFTILLLQWEYNTLFRQGIEDDLVLCMFQEDGKRTPATRGRVLRYEPIIQEIKGGYAARLTTSGLESRLSIIDGIHIAGGRPLQDYRFPILAADMVNIAVLWWKPLLAQKLHKLQIKEEQEQRAEKRMVLQNKRAYLGPVQGSPRPKKRLAV